MKLSKWFVSGALLFTTTLQAQQTPWANLPATKKVSGIEGDDKIVRLKPDTLFQQKEESSPAPFSYEMKTWYGAPANKIGYGYVTEEGKPYGVWRYYTLTGVKYELFCEGYYESLTADRLVIKEDLAKQYASTDFGEVKRSFTQNTKEPFFFSGEWRFYKNNKLDKIITLDNKAILPLEEMTQFNDAGAISSVQLLIASSENKRLSGLWLSTVQFSASGRITHVSAKGVELKFTKEGQPVIYPLAEPAFIE